MEKREDDDQEQLKRKRKGGVNRKPSSLVACVWLPDTVGAARLGKEII